MVHICNVIILSFHSPNISRCICPSIYNSVRKTSCTVTFIIEKCFYPPHTCILILPLMEKQPIGLQVTLLNMFEYSYIHAFREFPSLASYCAHTTSADLHILSLTRPTCASLFSHRQSLVSPTCLAHTLTPLT